MEIPEVRRRLRSAIEAARREAAARRERTDAAARAYDTFLEQHAVPAFQAIASALAGEGHRFKVFTPAGSVRLSAESAAENFIEISLDASQDPPQVMGRTNVGRGRRLLTSERPVREGTSVEHLTDDDVLEFLLAEIAPFVQR